MKFQWWVDVAKRFQKYYLLLVLAGLFYLGFGITLRVGNNTLKEIAFDASLGLTLLCLAGFVIGMVPPLQSACRKLLLTLLDNIASVVEEVVGNYKTGFKIKRSWKN